jgi:hypothetical protein
MKKTIYFISGVSGVGKTSVMRLLKSLLPNSYEVHDFDERGVPAGADHVWRIGETRHWIELGHQKALEGITVVICGFSNPDETQNIQTDFPDIEIRTVLLDGEAEVIERRLRGRNANNAVRADLERVVGSAEDFIQNNTKFVPVLREVCARHGCEIIDTTHLSPEQVANKVMKHIA